MQYSLSKRIPKPKVGGIYLFSSKLYSTSALCGDIESEWFLLVLLTKRNANLIIHESFTALTCVSERLKKCSWTFLQIYICKTRPALEILSPPPAVWLAWVHTKTGATQISTVIFSESPRTSSQQDTGFALSNDILVPAIIDVEKLSSIISVAFRRSICETRI